MSKYIGTPVVNVSVDTVDVTGDITTTDTTPEVIIVNNTHEDTDGGREGKVTFKGQQSGGEETTLAQIQASHDGTSDDEKGDLIFKTNDGSDGASPTERLRIDSSGNVGIGTASPSDLLELSGDTAQPAIRLTDADVSGLYHRIFTPTNTGLAISADTGNVAADSFLRFDVDGTEAMRIDSSGQIGIGNTNPDAIIRADSTANKILFKHNPPSNRYFSIAESSDGTYDNAITTFYKDASVGQFVFETSSGERMRIDNSGNVGIGVTPSSGVRLDVRNNSTTTLADMRNANSSGYGIYIAAGSSSSQYVQRWADYNNNSLATIDSSGNLLLGVTTSPSNSGAVFEGGANPILNIGGTSTSNTGRMRFRNPNGIVGSITTSGSSTAYNTSSDYRLKENVTDFTDGITRVKQLAPKRFNFIVDPDTTVDGFLAHEAQAVVPEAITGTHNEVEVWEEGEELPDGVSVGDNKLDDDGNTIPVYQGIDQSKLVPLLTAALQEAIAKIETLETKVAALEGE